MTFGAVLPALLVAALSASQPEERTASRACDGSALVAVGDGYVLNATDEDNVIRLYHLGVPEPAASFHLDAFLKPESNKRGNPKEVDIEGVARTGDRLYWIGSHGNDKNGNRETSRDRLFATNLTGRGANTAIVPVGRSYTNLRRSFDGLPEPVRTALAKAASLPPEKGGLNIEGLAAAAGGELLIGFRSPLIDGKALVLRLRNPATVVEQGAEPAYGAPLLVSFDGLGIRALEPKSSGDTEDYWVLAGPTGGDAGAVKLYEWKPGLAAKASTKRLESKKGEAAEGLTVDEQHHLWVSWDAGDVDACKDRPVDQRSFPIRQID